MKRTATKSKAQKILALVVMLVLVCALGNALNVQAKTYSQTVHVSSLTQGDIISANVRIDVTDVRDYEIYLDGEDQKRLASQKYDKEQKVFYYEFDRDVKLEKGELASYLSSGNEYYTGKFWFVTYVPGEDSDESGLSEEQKAQLRAEAWKKSPQNPKNYLPEVTLADGSTVVSTVPSHYMSGRDGGVSAVFSNTGLGDFYRALGVSGGNGVHLYSYKSLCGPLMKQLIADHAAALSEKCGAEVTVADIFEMQAEIRDKNYKLVEVVTESSEAVDIVIGLQGDLLKTAEAGADFAVLVYADGEMSVCPDTDEEISTLTIHTTKTSGIYAIVYAPKGTFDGIE